MAEINCPKCGESIPEEVEACPHCGFEIPDGELEQVSNQDEPKNDESTTVEEESKEVSEKTESEVSSENENNSEAEKDEESPAEEEKEEAKEEVKEDKGTTTEDKIPDTTDNSSKTKSKSLKIVLIILAALILIAVVVFALFRFDVFSKKGNTQTVKVVDDVILFIEDKELYYAKIGKEDKKHQVTTNLLSDCDPDEINKYLDYMSGLVTLSPDGKEIFYPDKINGTDEDSGFNIYCRSTTDWDKDPIKVDSGIISYCINKDASKITYLKEGNIYQSDLENKTKVASEIRSAYMSDDCKTFVYQNKDGDIYTWDSNTEQKTKVATDASIKHVTEDFSTIYFIANKDEDTGAGTLYRFPIGGEKEKIDSNVSSVNSASDKIITYRVKQESDVNLFEKYFNDDTLNKDTAILASDSYSEDYYLAKFRDEIREKYSEEDTEYTYTLKSYTPKTKESKVILENGEYSDSFICDDIIYICNEKENIKKINMSYFDEEVYDEIYYYSDIDDIIEDNTTTTYDIYAYYNGKLNNIAEDLESMPSVCPYKDSLLLAEYNDEEEKSADLYIYSRQSDGSFKKSVYDTDISDINIVYYGKEESIVTIKNLNHENCTADFYIDKELISYDVSYGIFYKIENSSFYESKKNFLYCTDYSSKNEDFTLMYKGNDKPIRIADEVYSGVILPDKSILYLTDYSLKSNYGTLSRYVNGKQVKISDDCNCIIPIYSYEDSIDHFTDIISYYYYN